MLHGRAAQALAAEVAGHWQAAERVFGVSLGPTTAAPASWAKMT
jgi:hypothetical protein